MSNVLVHLENNIKTIAFDNVKRKNAITKTMVEMLHKAVLESETDGTRVIVLTGEGDNFCSGADLMAGEDLADVTKYLQNTVNPAILAMRNTNLPIIAKISGVCVGLGFNIALACDMLFASDDARFSQIFTNIALSSDGGGAFFLTRRIGYYKAFELMAMATVFSGEEAKAFDFLNKVCPKTELNDLVNTYTKHLAEGPFIALKHTKANIREGMNGNLESTLALEAINQGENFKAKDFMEGVAAFMQKRKANYTGE